MSRKTSVLHPPTKNTDLADYCRSDGFGIRGAENGEKPSSEFNSVEVRWRCTQSATSATKQFHH